MSDQDILTALKGLVLVCGSTGDSFEDFEEQAEAFRKETGFMRPGKDSPAAYGGEDDRELRHERYAAWVTSKVQAARDALVKAEAPRPIECVGKACVSPKLCANPNVRCALI